MQLGIDSFAAAAPANDSSLRAAGSGADALGQLLDRIERADQVGLDVFGIGEHHRAEFLDLVPTIILGAAARTQRIRLTSAVTVLSAADPVRVFQQFATLDLISRGRMDLVRPSAQVPAGPENFRLRLFLLPGARSPAHFRPGRKGPR